MRWSVHLAAGLDGLPDTGADLTGLMIAGGVLVLVGGLVLGLLALLRRRPGP
jgi:hypothetical protein